MINKKNNKKMHVGAIVLAYYCASESNLHLKSESTKCLDSLFKANKIIDFSNIKE